MWRFRGAFGLHAATIVELLGFPCLDRSRPGRSCGMGTDGPRVRDGHRLCPFSSVRDPRSEGKGTDKPFGFRPERCRDELRMNGQVS
jgi:hypothetical protein